MRLDLLLKCVQLCPGSWPFSWITKTHRQSSPYSHSIGFLCASLPPTLPLKWVPCGSVSTGEWNMARVCCKIVSTILGMGSALASKQLLHSAWQGLGSCLSDLAAAMLMWWECESCHVLLAPCHRLASSIYSRRCNHTICPFFSPFSFFLFFPPSFLFFLLVFPSFFSFFFPSPATT